MPEAVEPLLGLIVRIAIRWPYGRQLVLVVLRDSRREFQAVFGGR